MKDLVSSGERKGGSFYIWFNPSRKKMKVSMTQGEKPVSQGLDPSGREEN